MSAEMVSPGPGSPPAAARSRQRAVRPVVGVLPDGTAFYAPLAQVVVDGPGVTCHLCGRSFRSVTAHLTWHGWTKDRYCEAFGLERGQSLEGPDTRKLRAAAFSARLTFEPAVREGSAAGRKRAKNGELTKDASAAARGRSFPEQRRQKAVQALAAIPPAVAARASRELADRRLAAIAAAAAARHGYPDIASYVTAMIRQGASLASISREAGLHKDWLSRHLGRIDPVGAQAARERFADRRDAHWLEPLGRLGFHDVASYLRDRHLGRRQSINAIAAEIGFSHHAVDAALRRHGLTRVPHAAKRHAAEQREAQVARSAGFPSLADYISQRRAEGWTWNAIAAESGQPQTWLRRHAATLEPGGA